MSSKMPLTRSFLIILGAVIIFGFSFTYLILKTNYSPANLNPSKLFQVLRDASSVHVNETELCADFCEALGDVSRSHASVNNSGIAVHGDSRNETSTTLPVSSQPPNEGAHAGEVLEAQRLATQVRVLCWVMTSPSNHQIRAKHVKNTWGKRCNKLIFMSSQADEKLGAVGLPNVQEGRDWLWAKTKEAFKYVWEHHRDEADWFMKADDDTYVIVENLRLMLSQADPDDPVYFGCRFKLEPHVKQGYMSGGPGYLLSREALRRFVDEALPDENKCRQDHKGAEDLEIGKCLEAVGVKAGDSRDGIGRLRFLPLSVQDLVVPGDVDQSYWYWQMIDYPHIQGMNCCSEVAISFHYIRPQQMYLMEYLIYRLRVFGSTSHRQLLQVILKQEATR